MLLIEFEFDLNWIGRFFVGDDPTNDDIELEDLDMMEEAYEKRDDEDSLKLIWTNEPRWALRKVPRPFCLISFGCDLVSVGVVSVVTVSVVGSLLSPLSRCSI